MIPSDGFFSFPLLLMFDYFVDQLFFSLKAHIHPNALPCKSEFRVTQSFQKTSKICCHRLFSLQSDPARLF